MFKSLKLNFFLISLISLISLTFISLSIGSSGLGFFELINSDSIFEKTIFYDLRLSRTMLAVFVGCLLAGSGVLLQSLLQNPLSEPYTLGLSGGASLGTVLFIALGVRTDFVAIGSFLGCWGVTLLILKARKIFIFNSRSLILFGVMLSFLCGAIVTLLITLLEPKNLPTAMFWLIGQVGYHGKYWPLVAVCFFVVLIWVVKNHKKLDMFLIDTKTANAIRKDSKVRTSVILLVSLMTSVAVCFSGLIGFVGLLTPHIAKMYLKTSKHLSTFLFSSILGGIFLLLADVLARWLGGDLDIPAGSITAIVGAPFFIYILFSKKSVG